MHILHSYSLQVGGIYINLPEFIKFIIMTKIVHLGKYYPPDMGGTEIVTQSLAQAASENGYDVNVICFDQSGTGGRIDGKVNVKRFPILKMIKSQPISIRYFIAAIREGRRADIIHLHSPNFVAALASMFVGRKCKLLVHWHMDVVNKGLLGRMIVPLEKMMLTRADVIVTTSQRYADCSTSLKPFATKLRVVPLGVSAPKFNQNHFDLSPRLSSFIAGRKFVLSVGRLSAYKGYSVLVEAANYLPEDVAIIIAGSGGLMYELNSLIDLHKLGNKVLLAGRVSPEDLSALYQNAALFCLPSILRSEAFGVVLLEAMTYGLPIVATNIEGSGVSWVNAHEVSGLNVTPGNALELAAACARILNDEGLRSSYSQGSKSRFQSNFTEDIFHKASLDVYRDILDAD